MYIKSRLSFLKRQAQHVTTNEILFYDTMWIHLCKEDGEKTL